MHCYVDASRFTVFFEKRARFSNFSTLATAAGGALLLLLLLLSYVKRDTFFFLVLDNGGDHRHQRHDENVWNSIVRVHTAVSVRRESQRECAHEFVIPAPEGTSTE